MMPAPRHLLLLAVLPGLTHAQAFDLNQILQQGVNGAIHTLISPPTTPATQPQPPPTATSAVPKKAASKPANGKQKPATGMVATSSKAKHAAPVALTQAKPPASIATAGDEEVTFRTVTRSSMIRPIVLPFYRDRPVIGYPDPNQQRLPSAAGQGEFSRWFTLLELVKRPERFQQPATALALANLFVAPDHFSTYFRCSPASCEPPASNPGKFEARVLGWRGENEFEQARAHQRFVKDYQALLRSEAPVEPVEIYLVDQARIGQYSAPKGGLDLPGIPRLKQDAAFSDIIKPYQARVIRAISLTTEHTASTHITVPQTLACKPEACEQLLNTLDSRDRLAWVIAKLRLKATGPSADSRSKTPTFDAQLAGPMVLHRSRQFNAPLYTLAEPKQLPAPGLDGQAPLPLGNQPATLNGDTLALLILKHHPRGAEQIDALKAAQVRFVMDAEMYDQAPGRQWPGRWGPFFPATGTALHELNARPQSEATVAAFSRWSRLRSTQPLQDISLGFSFDRPAQNSKGTLPLLSHSLWYPYGRTGDGILASNLQPAQTQDTRSISDGLDRAGIVAADRLMLVRHTLGAAGTTLSNYVAFGFPAPLASYVVPDAAKAEPTRNQLLHSEIHAAIRSVSFAPAPDGKSIMVVQLEPRQARLYDGNTLLAEAGSDTLAALARPQAAGGEASYDILGLRLGMPLSEAEKKVRAHLRPDLVYAVQAKGASSVYQQARLFVSTTAQEIFVLYFATDQSVTGVERRVSLPPQTPIEAVRDPILEKYGTQHEEPRRGVWRWAARTPAPFCTGVSSFASTTALLEGTEPTRAANQPVWDWLAYAKANAMRIGISPNHARQQNLEIRTRCQPTLEVHVRLDPAPKERGRLDFALYDHGAGLRASNADATPEPPKPQVDLAL